MANYPFANYQQEYGSAGYGQQNYNRGYNYQQPQQQGFMCRPVSSRAEAEAVPVDFMGAPMYFPDLSADKVYCKRWNAQRGATDFAEYTRTFPEQSGGDMSGVFGMLEALNQKMDRLFSMNGGGDDD